MPKSGLNKKKVLRILSVLKTATRPMSSSQICEELISLGYEISERTIRLYLKEMDRLGLSMNQGRKGRQITEQGVFELRTARIFDRVGFLSAKIDQMTFGMNFDLSAKSGTVVVNISIVDPGILKSRIERIGQVFARGYAMGTLAGLFYPGEQCGPYTIPENKVGFGTVCSITLNGVLLKYGIPTHSRFGGLLELRKGVASRFVEIIQYDGTTIDPLEVFIKSGMTDYVGAITDGNGRIGASFREVPADSRELVLELARKLDEARLGGFMQVGKRSQPLMGIPVSEGRSGIIVIGGLNPVAILEETGERVQSKALAGLLEYHKLIHYSQLVEKVQAF